MTLDDEGNALGGRASSDEFDTFHGSHELAWTPNEVKYKTQVKKALTGAAEDDGACIQTSDLMTLDDLNF